MIELPVLHKKRLQVSPLSLLLNFFEGICLSELAATTS